MHHECNICASSVHHQYIISASLVLHQRIIIASSVHHQCIISASSAHHQRIIRPGQRRLQSCGPNSRTCVLVQILNQQITDDKVLIFSSTMICTQILEWIKLCTTQGFIILGINVWDAIPSTQQFWRWGPASLACSSFLNYDDLICCISLVISWQHCRLPILE